MQLIPAGSWILHGHVLTPLAAGWGRESRGKMWEKSWTEIELSESKAAHASKTKQGIHFLFLAVKQMFCYFQETRATLFTMVTWECKLSFSESPQIPPSPSSYCWAWPIIVWAVPLVAWDQLSPLCPLLLVLPQPLLC